MIPEVMKDRPRWKATRAVGTKFGFSYKLSPDGQLRAPFSAKLHNLADICIKRVNDCKKSNLCSACGKSFEPNENKVFLRSTLPGLNKAGTHRKTDVFKNAPHLFETEPPLHDGCARYALRVCPHFKYALNDGRRVFLVHSAKVAYKFEYNQWCFAPVPDYHVEEIFNL